MTGRNTEKTADNEIKEIEKSAQRADIGEKIIEERKERILKFLKKKSGFSWIVYGVLALIIWINVYIRTLPMRVNAATGKPGLWDIARDNWTLGPDLDPFLFLRYAKEIAANGKLMAVDYLRYAPLGFETRKETMLLPYMIEYFHKFLNLFKEISIEYCAIILPVVVSVFTAIFFFLLVRKIFEERGKKQSNITALIATGLMVLLPNLLTRTIAGIPEKESVGFCFMFLAFYLFLSAWKSKSIKRGVILGVSAGIATAALGLTWGGVMLTYAAIVLFGFVVFILGKVKKQEFAVYSCWLISSIIFYLPFTLKTTFKSFLLSPVYGATIVVWAFMTVNLLLSDTKLKESRILQNRRIKSIPKELFSAIICILAAIILVIVIFGFNTIINMVNEVYISLFPRFTSRLISTVAENKQSYFSDIKSAMGPIVKGIPLFFWLFFAGSVFLFYRMIKELKNKEKNILTLSYIIFLLALIFSRKSESSILNGQNSLSIFVNAVGYVILLGAFIYVYYRRYAEKELLSLKELKAEYVFITVLIFVGIIAARSGVRFIMLFTPFATIPVAYLVVNSFVLAFRSQGDVKRILCWVLVSIVVLSSIFTFNIFYKTSYASGINNVPDQYTHQWQDAMGWVRENTPKDAVFGHWWDYGYWLQSIGERATMLDGGNFIAYWNYLMGRHVLTAESESEALELLYNHNVTHYLIDSTEIGKYTAYSLIGSNENYDRYSYIGTFLKEEAQTQETKENTIYIYTGGVSFDEDVIINENGKDILLPRQAAAVAVLVVYKEINSDFSQPDAIVVYNSKQYKIPLRYLFVNGELIDFGNEKKDTFNGCVYLISRLYNDGRIGKEDAALYLSPRNMRALWVRLYLIGQEEHFKLVHKEPSSVAKFLKSQGITDLSDVIYYQGLHGPIKIWEIGYTGKEKFNPEYVQTEFPERIISRMYA